MDHTFIVKSKRYKFLLHVLFWFIYVFFAIIHKKYYSDFYNIDYVLFVFFNDFFTINFIIFFFVPKYLQNNIRFTKFVLYFILIIAANFSLSFTFNCLMLETISANPESFFNNMAYFIQHSLIFILIASGVKIHIHNLLIKEQISEKQNELVRSELEILKLQMNPHFLFNTLNNIYIQIKLSPENAIDSILRLSDILRYQIFECTESKVFIKSEIEYLKNYLELQKVRYSNLETKINKKGDLHSAMIYPFLLINFTENALKKGVSSTNEKNFINIDLEIIKNKLHFSIESSKIISNLQKNGLEGNTVVKNIRKRLDKLYPNNYNLEIIKRDYSIFVKLEINLDR